MSTKVARTTYQLRADDPALSSNHRAEYCAIAKAARLDRQGIGSRVYMLVQSGTYHSSTRIWPSLGPTWAAH